MPPSAVSLPTFLSMYLMKPSVAGLPYASLVKPETPAPPPPLPASAVLGLEPALDVLLILPVLDVLDVLLALPVLDVLDTLDVLAGLRLDLAANGAGPPISSSSSSSPSI